MYSKRFREKVKELGKRKAVNDWFVFACWRANIRRFPNTNDPLFEKYIGE